jgi:hypothetical protein
MYCIASAMLFFCSKASSEFYVTKFDNRSPYKIILRSDSNQSLQVNPEDVSDYRLCKAEVAILANNRLTVYSKNKRIGTISKGEQCDLAAWNITVCSVKNKHCNTQCLTVDEAQDHIATELTYAKNGNLYFSDSVPTLVRKKTNNLLIIIKELTRVAVTSIILNIKH